MCFAKNVLYICDQKQYFFSLLIDVSSVLFYVFMAQILRKILFS